MKFKIIILLIIIALFINPSFSQETDLEVDQQNNDNSTCSSAQSMKKCDIIYIDDFLVNEPYLFPCCLASLIVGVYCSYKTISKKKTSYKVYGLTFLLIGIMMTSAGILHCILPGIVTPNIWKFDVLFLSIDDGLTCSIAMGFFLCALVDLQIIKDSCKTLFTYLCIIVTLVYYVYTLTMQKNINQILTVYMILVGLGCGFWVIAQLYLLSFKLNCKGFYYFFLAGFSGGIGFFGLMIKGENTWLCEHFNCHVNDDFIWFLVTPLCAYFIYKYYAQTHNIVIEKNQQNNMQNQILLAPIINTPYAWAIKLNNSQNNIILQQPTKTELVSYHNL